jgi:hypothetical protein
MIDVDFSAEPSIVRAVWDEREPKLYVLLDTAEPEAVRAIGQRLLPALAADRASLAVGPDDGITPSARGVVVYER